MPTPTPKYRLQYTPFGSSLNTRRFSAGSGFRFGFNTQEKDKEVYNNNETYTATFWEYDGRLGRRWNVDPVSSASKCIYLVFNNNPIVHIDANGRYSKIGAWWRSKFDNGEKIYKLGNEWGYNTIKEDENDNEKYTLVSNFGKPNYKPAKNLGEVLIRSAIVKNEHVKLTGNLLEQIKQDPDLIRYQNKLVDEAKIKYSTEPISFNLPTNPELITFGGFTGSPLNPLNQETKEVASNELTWVIRHAQVYTNVEIQEDGIMTINYLLIDKLDLYPSTDRTLGYNVVCLLTGTIYHIGLGGVASKLKANWTTQINLNEK